MIEQAHFDKVVSYLDKTKSQGAMLITGGGVREIGSGWYVEPTIFDGVTPDMNLFKESVWSDFGGNELCHR